MRITLANAIRVSAIGLTILTTTSHALAAPTKKTKPPVETTPTTAKPQHMDFDDDIVDGSLTTPDYSVVDPNRAVRHGSLIKPRTTFIPELLKSAEDL